MSIFDRLKAAAEAAKNPPAANGDAPVAADSIVTLVGNSGMTVQLTPEQFKGKTLAELKRQYAEVLGIEAGNTSWKFAGNTVPASSLVQPNGIYQAYVNQEEKG